METYVTSVCLVTCAAVTYAGLTRLSHLTLLSVCLRTSFAPARAGLFCAPDVILELCSSRCIQDEPEVRADVT